ncbi:hypothetical protein [Variovorax boronicumulans]
MSPLAITPELSQGLEKYGLFVGEGAVLLLLPFRFETPVRLWPAVPG